MGGIESLESYEFLQVDSSFSSLQIPNKTEFKNPPLPRTKVPGNPCNDPDKGAPSAADKRAAKCTLSKGNCYKLQERFLLIQSGMKDEEADLNDELAKVEYYCKKQTDGL